MARKTYRRDDADCGALVFGAAVALVLATTTPSGSEDDISEVLTGAVQDTGVVPAYHLGAGKLDGDLGRADGRAERSRYGTVRAGRRSGWRGRGTPPSRRRPTNRRAN